MILVKRVADSIVILVDTEESVKEFKELVQRGSNLWPDASPDIKEFADLITNGNVLQDYHNQTLNKRKTS